MRILKAPFWKSLLWAQNRHHKHGVLIHTLKVTMYLIKKKYYRMILAGLLHDIGKPFVAFQDESDLKRDYLSYSFINHEEASYQIIKNWNFVSNYTKDLVRYHYLLRDLKLSKAKGKFARYNRLHKIYNKLSNEMKKDLALFLICDDLGKK